MFRLTFLALLSVMSGAAYAAPDAAPLNALAKLPVGITYGWPTIHPKQAVADPNSIAPAVAEDTFRIEHQDQSRLSRGELAPTEKQTEQLSLQIWTLH